MEESTRDVEPPLVGCRQFRFSFTSLVAFSPLLLFVVSSSKSQYEYVHLLLEDRKKNLHSPPLLRPHFSLPLFDRLVGSEMKRPADQAKLLFLYLLQKSAVALRQDHICLRLARRTDVSSIQRCNLATLPENYNSEFYISHMRQWPDLCVVAEHVSSRSSSIPTFGRPDPKIVGYVLGKVEYKQPQMMTQSPFAVLPKSLSPDDHEDFYLSDYPREEEQPLGHVTSLAVLHDYRRMGLAAALMEQLHYHLERRHGCTEVGLHVRKSNRAACRLYRQDGYEVETVIPHYYQDGEDAYLMRKDLLGFSSSKELFLPRELPLIRPKETTTTTTSTEPSIRITGTL